VKAEPRSAPQKPLGQWLVENVPRGLELELPDRKSEPEREIPFQVRAASDRQGTGVRFQNRTPR